MQASLEDCPTWTSAASTTHIAWMALAARSGQLIGYKLVTYVRNNSRSSTTWQICGFVICLHIVCMLMCEVILHVAVMVTLFTVVCIVVYCFVHSWFIGFAVELQSGSYRGLAGSIMPCSINATTQHWTGRDKAIYISFSLRGSQGMHCYKLCPPIPELGETQGTPPYHAGEVSAQTANHLSCSHGYLAAQRKQPITCRYLVAQRKQF